LILGTLSSACGDSPATPPSSGRLKPNPQAAGNSKGEGSPNAGRTDDATATADSAESGSKDETAATPATPVIADPVPTVPVVVVPPAPPVTSSEGDGRFELNAPFARASESNGRGGLKGSTQDLSYTPRADSIFKSRGSRGIKIYLPPGMDKAKDYPFMVAMDSNYWTEPLLTTVDNLILDKKIPAMIILFAQNGGGDAEGSQRGREYDLLGPDNGRFFAEEVIPDMEARFGIRFSKDPEAGGAFGGSSSGAAAFTMAWFYTQRFTKVLSYSATLTMQGRSEAYPAGGYGYAADDFEGAKPENSKLIAHDFEKTKQAKPIRVCLQYGSKDNDFGRYRQQSVSNENTYKALKDAGYHVRLHKANGAGHVDGAVMGQTMAENLIWLWRDFPR
jgi:enterochelin esterase-like enzyme